MKKKIFAFAMAFAMVLSMITPNLVRAQEDKGNNISTAADAKTESVTLHKLLMSKTDLKAWDKEEAKKKYDGQKIDINELKTAAGAQGEVKDIGGAYFAWKFVGGDNNGKYIKAKEGNKKAPAEPLTATDNVEEAMGGLTVKDEGITFETSKLEGQFQIVELREKSNYVGADKEVLADAKAVPVDITLPLVNNEGTVINAAVYPKNTENKPQIDKNFLKKEAENNGLTAAEIVDKGGFGDEEEKLGANYDNYSKEKATVSATIGKIIPYEVKTTIPEKTHYKTLIFSDTMTKGLTFNKDSLAMKVTGSDLSINDFNVTKTDSGFRMELKKEKASQDKIDNKDDAIKITITYNATVNSAAVSDNPDNNNIRLEYGNTPQTDREEGPEIPNVTQIQVNKTWAEGTAPAGVKVTYDLYVKTDNSWKIIDTVEKSGTDFNHTFTGLDNTKTYKVEERPNGYLPGYTYDNNGTLAIKNVKSPNPTPLEPTNPKVVTYGKKFVKTNDKEASNNPERLVGAEFVVKKGNKFLAVKDVSLVEAEKAAYKQAQTEYIDLVKSANSDNPKTAEIKAAKDKRDKAFKAAFTQYGWVDSQDAALKLGSDDQGRFEITGLEKGTYYLVETKAPKGYAALADQEFTVDANSYTQDGNIRYEKQEGDDQTGADAKQVKNKKVTIPETGGIGTIIFTVAGLALMATAIISMKKRKAEDN